MYERASHCRDMACLAKAQSEIRDHIQLIHETSHVVKPGHHEEEEEEDGDDEHSEQDDVQKKEEAKIENAISESKHEGNSYKKHHYPYHHGYIHDYHREEEDEQDIHHNLLDFPLHYHPRLPNLSKLEDDEDVHLMHHDHEEHDSYLPESLNLHESEDLLHLN